MPALIEVSLRFAIQCKQFPRRCRVEPCIGKFFKKNMGFVMFLLVASFSVNEKMYSLLVLTSTASVKLKQRLPVKGLIIKMLTENIILFPFRNLGAPVGHPARITSSEPYTSFWTNTGVQNSRWLTSMSCRKGNIAVSRPNLDGR